MLGYPVRPLVCRAVRALDREALRRGADRGRPGGQRLLGQAAAGIAVSVSAPVSGKEAGLQL